VASYFRLAYPNDCDTTNRSPNTKSKPSKLRREILSEEALEIIQPSNSALASAIQSSSWGDEEEEQVKPRYIKIRQSKSEDMEEFELGNFVDKTGGEQWDEITLVPLGVRLTRKLQTPFKPGTKSELLCRSANRIRPVTTDDRFEPKAENCEDCAFGQKAWANWKKDKIKPANPCEQEIEFLFIEAADPTQPYIYVASGKATGVMEELYDKMRNRSKTLYKKSLKETGVGIRPELYEFEVTLITQKGTGTAAEFWYPYVKEVQELTKEDATEKYGEAYDIFVRARREAFEAAREAADGEEAVNEKLAGKSTVVETPAAPATKPVVNAAVIPPATARKVGTRPVYKAPVTIDAKAEVKTEDTPFT
jgi:hypothetical protein